MHHVQTAPLPPSRLTEMPVPKDLERVVMSCLEKDPARRPQSAAELSELLEQCAVESEWDNERARRWWEVHRPEGAPS